MIAKVLTQRIFPAVFAACFLLSCCAAPAQQPRELHVAAAADLQPVLPVLAQEFEKQSGIRIVASFGSSSTLATQILNGAPVDLFLSADFLFPEKLVAAGLTEEKTPWPYAKGTLVLWARKDLGFAPTMDSLMDPRVTRIAVANRDHAPYGRAAYEAMTWLKTLDKLQPKLVVAENVTQTGQFVESGNAQIGFISLTMASTPHFQELGVYERVPDVYPVLQQCGVVLKGSPHKADALAFKAWLLSLPVQNRLHSFGLSPAS